MNIGVIGCGNMGGGMINTLLRAGQDVYCFDANTDAQQRMSAQGAHATKQASTLAEQCELIILSLPNADIVTLVMNEIAQSIKPDTVVLDTSTSTPATSQTQSAVAEKQGYFFLDGPVSGGPAAANSGTMTMLLAGNLEAINRIQMITDILTARAIHVGTSGAGHAAKIANNMLCAANLVLVAEAVRMGEAAGVNAEHLLAGINAGSGRSGVSEVNFPKWVNNEAFDSGFSMGLMRKDVGLALDLASEHNLALKGFAGIADLWLKHSGEIADTADFNEITKACAKPA